MEKPGTLIEERIQKAQKLTDMGASLYPAGYGVDTTVAEAVELYGAMDEEALEKENRVHTLAGRVMAVRDFGKAAFIHIKDRTGRVQAYIRKDKVDAGKFDIFKLVDIGDIVGVKGAFFRTRTKELTVLAEDVDLLSKSLRPLPEKWHGLTDRETRYRQRYLDLAVNDDVKNVFIMRSRIVQAVREFFIQKDFLEVENMPTEVVSQLSSAAAAKKDRSIRMLMRRNLLNRDGDGERCALRMPSEVAERLVGRGKEA